MEHTDTVVIQVNGERQELPAGSNILHLLQRMEIPLKRVAVEHNRVIVKPAAWEQTAIATGDEIEIVHFVGGGK